MRTLAEILATGQILTEEKDQFLWYFPEDLAPEEIPLIKAWMKDCLGPSDRLTMIHQIHDGRVALDEAQDMIQRLQQVITARESLQDPSVRAERDRLREEVVLLRSGRAARVPPKPTGQLVHSIRVGGSPGRWQCTLACGHERWIRTRARPTPGKTTATCPRLCT